MSQNIRESNTICEREAITNVHDMELAVAGLCALARIITRAVLKEIPPSPAEAQAPRPEMERIPQESRTSGSDRLITAEQLADKLSMPISSIYRLAREGKLPAIRLGRLLRFEPTLVSEVLEMGRTD